MEFNDIKFALKHIVLNQGVETYNDTNLLIAYLSDYGSIVDR